MKKVCGDQHFCGTTFRDSPAQVGVDPGGVDADADQVPEGDREAGEAEPGAEVAAAPQRWKPGSQRGHAPKDQCQLFSY